MTAAALSPAALTQSKAQDASGQAISASFRLRLHNSSVNRTYDGAVAATVGTEQENKSIQIDATLNHSLVIDSTGSCDLRLSILHAGPQAILKRSRQKRHIIQILFT